MLATGVEETVTNDITHNCHQVIIFLVYSPRIRMKLEIIPYIYTHITQQSVTECLELR